MSVQNLLNTQPRTDSRPAAAGRSKPAGSSFQEKLVQTSAVVEAAPIHLRMPTENTVYSGAHAGRNSTMQEVYAEYAPDSTPEDPVVRITGVSDSGPYDFTCHIKDVNPSNASYAELAALYGHLARTGALQIAPSGDVLPTGLETGDITERRDYLSMIDRHQYDPHFGDVCKAQAAELLAVYQPYASEGGVSRSASAPDHSVLMKNNLLSALADFKTSALERMEKAKENEEDQKAWEKLLKYLDAWIESLREEADVRKIAQAHAALAALQTDAESNRPDLGDYLLEQLRTAIA
ncbi:hypothetical protein [Oscillibacter sp.]|uniref:hypothetical protein n=1 Tax=Oscillibacter sp. TaxID=1945593 RepID=UPI002D7E7931|nr:hypothetical protein [Oscillibacter sp.]